MAKVLGEFDAESPAPKRFCTRLTSEEFEQQSAICTEKALQDLISYLKYNPSAFYATCQKRQNEELENKSFMSFLKNRFLSWYLGEEYCSGVMSGNEAKEKMKEFQENALKAFHYGQESKGQRRSQRLAKKKQNPSNNPEHVKRMRHVAKKNVSTNTSDRVNQTPVLDQVTHIAPPPSPPPPPPPPVSSTPALGLSTSHTAYQMRNRKTQLKQHKEENDTTRQRCESADFDKVLEAVRSGRKHLKPITTNETNTPDRSQNGYPFFNQHLIQKFKKARGSPLLNSPLNDTGFTP